MSHLIKVQTQQLQARSKYVIELYHMFHIAYRTVRYIVLVPVQPRGMSPFCLTGTVCTEPVQLTKHREWWTLTWPSIRDYFIAASSEWSRIVPYHWRGPGTTSITGMVCVPVDSSIVVFNESLLSSTCSPSDRRALWMWRPKQARWIGLPSRSGLSF